jgi:hypothetical protein
MPKKHLPFYNVDKSVGKFAVNSPSDVLLVQFFLTEIAKVPPHPIPPPQTPLALNGVPSPALNEWIKWFQDATSKAGKVIIADGRIDPAQIHNGSIWGGQGTIVHMNMTYRNRFRSSHDALEKAPNCPPGLSPGFAAAEVNT